MTTFVGNKNIPGVLQFLINRLPVADRHFSFFFGSGGLETSVYTRAIKWICSEANPDNHHYAMGTNASIVANDYRSLLEDFVLTAGDFVFADPPYLIETRRNGRLYYGKYEWSDPDHIFFLEYMKASPAMVMITHPICAMYENALTGWYREPITYRGHQGQVEDCVWRNYDHRTKELLNYGALGEGFVERQAIKRQRGNIVRKFEKLDPHVRWALIDALRSAELI